MLLALKQVLVIIILVFAIHYDKFFSKIIFPYLKTVIDGLSLLQIRGMDVVMVISMVVLVACLV